MRRRVRAAAGARPVLLGPLPVAWNRENASDPAAGASALDWSITAMRDTAGRLAAVPGGIGAGFAAISEAVWWVTLVDATLVRHHPEPTKPCWRPRPQPERGQIEAPWPGSVRAQPDGPYLDPVDFIQPQRSRSGPEVMDIAAWRWRSRAGTGAGLAAAARTGVGDDAVPGLPVPARRSHHRGDVRPGRRVPQASFRQSNRCLTR